MCVTLGFFYWISRKSASRVMPVPHSPNETDVYFDMFNKQIAGAETEEQKRRWFCS